MRDRMELLTDENIEAVYSAIKELNEEEESVLSLRYYNKFDTAEIPVFFHIPIKDTHRLLESGLEKINTILGEGFYKDESELEKLLCAAFDLDVSAELENLEAVAIDEEPQVNTAEAWARFQKSQKRPSRRLGMLGKNVLSRFYRLYEKLL